MSSTSGTTEAPLANSGSASGGTVVNTGGLVDPVAYVAMAGKLSTDEGISYRYGAASTSPLASNTWYRRTDTLRANAYNDVRDSDDWQVGGPETPASPGDYFSNIGNALQVADSATSTGVTDYQSIAQRYNTFVQRPQLAPVLYGGGTDDFHALELNARNPVAAARCYGRPGWCAESVIAYQNGLIATGFGSNTAQNLAKLQLPANKVPTGVAITNSSEFALVTVWDTAALKGQIAVIALAGLGNGCTVQEPCEDNYWGEWQDAYPGLPNLGNIAFMKLLGFVDLPESMRAPTEIAATTGWNPWEGLTGLYGKPYAYDVPLSVDANRQTFMGTGANVSAYPKGGVAIVLSKSEKRAAFVDLKPLIAYFNSMYFGSQGDFQRTADVGTADNQWPFPFSQLPESVKPTVVKVVDLDSRPTAVKATLWGANLRGLIATEEGKLRLFDLGGYGNGSGANVGAIQQVGAVYTGPNPTSIAYFRANAGEMGSDINNQAIVLSRGDRAVRWVDLSADHNTGTVRKTTLTDSRLVDPVMVEDNQNHGTEARVLSIADYGGKTIHNYRYGPVIFWTNSGACQPPAGCGLGPNNLPVSQYPFEYGGPMPLAGRPFLVTSSNVP